MDIDQRNFWATLPTVLKAIAEATYVAIDLEMTGIKSKSNTKSSEWDVEEVYRQAKASATGFHILQFGLTCVRYNMSVNSKLELRTFFSLGIPIWRQQWLI